MGIFKAYDIRGTVPDELNPEIAYRIGNALAQFLGAKNIVAGRDMRISSPEIFDAAGRGIRDAGVDLVDIGLASTSACYFADGQGGYGGAMMVTASHNPARYNGFKLCREQAIPLSYESGIEEIESIVGEGDLVKAVRPGREIKMDITGVYLDHVLSFAQYIAPLKVAIDGGNGMAGKYIPLLFEKLPCRLIPLYLELDGRFPNHEANPLKEENLADLKKLVVKSGADLGVAFDGDADRVTFIDENGRTIANDITTALVAQETLSRYPGSAVIYDLRSSWVVAEVIQKMGGRAIESRVGHSYIKRHMREHNAVFGGELSGHYYFRENFYADNAEIALIKILNLISSRQEPISRIVEPLRKYAATGEINFQVEDKEGKIEELAEEFSDGEVYFMDGVSVRYPDWWFNVRKSNTEPLLRLNMEARTPELLEEVKRKVIAVITR
ncbi:MAG: phosphomannomutase/phosphoglucomutase [Candidatus Euphemobacter frigidus]|nr:phosphomannomutase/phosphoglucomutase [Candidatus Euphemobacter frigidus]